MSDNQEVDRRILEVLSRALEGWVRRGEGEPIDRWLARELDEQGMPVRLHLSAWPECLSMLIEARRERTKWSRSWDSRVLELARSVLRFSRPDARPAIVFAGPDRLASFRATLSACAAAYPRSPEARVIGWWLNRPESKPVPPPLPACSSTRGPLAALRASWQRDGDLLAIDHRWPDSTTRFELVGRGHSWLGPDWRLSGGAAAASKPRKVAWISNSVVDLTEWSYRTGDLRCTRTALMLRGRRLALLAEQVEDRSALGELLESRYAVTTGIAVEPIPDARGLTLRSSARGQNAQILPLALPCLPYETDRGQFRAAEADRSLSLLQMPRGRRCWMPILVSWDGQRHRKRLSWRVLTVSEDAKICPPDLAFAVRVSWGRDETYILYRSLGPPGLRAFLGHQTRARFLIGRLTSEGVVERLVSLE